MQGGARQHCGPIAAVASPPGATSAMAQVGTQPTATPAAVASAGSAALASSQRARAAPARQLPAQRVASPSRMEAEVIQDAMRGLAAAQHDSAGATSRLTPDELRGDLPAAPAVQRARALAVRIGQRMHEVRDDLQHLIAIVRADEPSIGHRVRNGAAVDPDQRTKRGAVEDDDEDVDSAAGWHPSAIGLALAQLRHGSATTTGGPVPQLSVRTLSSRPYPASAASARPRTSAATARADDAQSSLQRKRPSAAMASAGSAHHTASVLSGLASALLPQAARMPGRARSAPAVAALTPSESEITSPGHLLLGMGAPAVGAEVRHRALSPNGMLQVLIRVGAACTCCVCCAGGGGLARKLCQPSAEAASPVTDTDCRWQRPCVCHVRHDQHASLAEVRRSIKAVGDTCVAAPRRVEIHAMGAGCATRVGCTTVAPGVCAGYACDPWRLYCAAVLTWLCHRLSSCMSLLGAVRAVACRCAHRGAPRHRPDVRRMRRVTMRAAPMCSRLGASAGGGVQPEAQQHSRWPTNLCPHRQASLPSLNHSS